MAGSSKSTTDSHIQLDIRHLRKEGLLSPGKAGTFSWSIAGESLGTIGYKINDSGIVLYLGSGEILQTIFFDTTSCNYGGERFWFLCPECGSRREILYLNGKSFVCRKCADLNYQCQHEQQLARLQRRARKVRNKLKTDWLDPDNLGSPVLFKPKFMHESTFNKLRRKQVELINASGQVLLDRFG